MLLSIYSAGIYSWLLASSLYADIIDCGFGMVLGLNMGGGVFLFPFLIGGGSGTLFIFLLKVNQFLYNFYENGNS